MMQLKEIEVSKVIANPYQPRQSFDEESLNELADSQKSTKGPIQPIIVTILPNGQIVLIAGERRLKAAKKAGLKTILALIRETAKEDMLLESLIENLHRKDLESIEAEKAVNQLWKSGRWKRQKELAQALGKSEPWVGRFLIAAPIRKEEKINMVIPARTIAYTADLPKEERKQIIENVEKKQIIAADVQEYVSIVKKAEKAPELKEAILEKPQRFTPTVARQILELPKAKQATAVSQVQGLRLDEPEAIAHIQSMKQEIPLPPPEEIEQVRQRYQTLQNDLREKLSTPEAKERGALFRNWTAHIAIMGVVDSLFCPNEPNAKLGWFINYAQESDDWKFVPIEKAEKLAEQNYEKSMKK